MAVSRRQQSARNADRKLINSRGHVFRSIRGAPHRMRYEVYGRRLRIDLIRYDLAKVLDAELAIPQFKIGDGQTGQAQVRGGRSCAIKCKPLPHARLNGNEKSGMRSPRDRSSSIARLKVFLQSVRDR